ncbi:hypothetical protein GIB19_15540 [Pseudomonas sp. ITEM 17296]|uniref:reprolysin-like metallopeptidase n=1 Tax=Pseudomonas sp. ITEM 17296 TaxID=2790281 RepID=UPI000C127270|nr:hypothetical protein [Pseudomonas sp. ITEM 17296]ATP52851.1 hypothetical protein CR512_01590 [Pseudomonas putida]MDE4538628.1 hypothetical protein [Pseudomonas sp. ITEM 17296]
MKIFAYRAWLVIAGCALLAACSSSTPPESGTSSPVKQLFTLEPTPDRSTLQKTATGYLATLLANPANEEITLVDANAELINNSTQHLAVTLPDGKTAQFNVRDFSSMAGGYEGWVGYKGSAWKLNHPSPAEIDFDPRYYLSIVRHGTQLVGNLIVDNQRYQLESLGGRQHALIKVDSSKLPPEDSQGPQGHANEVSAVKTNLPPKSAHSTIRLLFVTTNQARANNPNYRAALILGLRDANQIAKNSQVAITYELAGFMDANHDETGKDFVTLLNDLTYRMPEVKVVRDRLRADLVSMLVANNELCGGGKPGPEKHLGFSAINCISSLAHEIGHNFGMSHSWNGESNTYTHGYQYKPASGSLRFRTQMAYDCSPACPRQMFFSNPRLSYQGQALGTVANHDVARAINERRETVENFYPPFTGKKVANVARVKLGLPACLTVTSSGALTFADCGSISESNFWYWNNSLWTTIRVQQGDTSSCLQWTANGDAAGMGACSGMRSSFNFEDGLIKFSLFGISNCLEGNERSDSPLFSNCSERDDVLWMALPY